MVVVAFLLKKNNMPDSTASGAPVIFAINKLENKEV